MMINDSNKVFTSLTFILLNVLLSSQVFAQKDIKIFFEGESKTRGESVYNTELLIIDQSGKHSYVKVQKDFKFQIKPDRKSVVVCLKGGFVPEFLILDISSQYLANGEHTIQKTFNISQYDPTSKEWTGQTKCTYLSYDDRLHKFQERDIKISKEEKEELLHLMMAEKYVALKNKYFEYIKDVSPDKFDEIFSSETKQLKDEVKKLKKEEVIAQNKVISMKRGIYYGAQIGAFSKQLDKKHDYYSKMPDLKYLPAKNGIYRYYSGSFKTLEEATAHVEKLRAKGIKDAFTIAMLGDQRITIPQNQDKNPDLYKWNQKIKRIEAELDYLDHNKERLDNEQVLINKELDEISKNTQIQVLDQDTSLRLESLKIIALDLKKNTAIKDVKEKSLDRAEKKLESLTEKVPVKVRPKIIYDTIYVPKDKTYERKAWMISAGIGLNHHNTTIPDQTGLLNYNNYHFSLSRKLSNWMRLEGLYQLGELQYMDLTLRNIQTPLTYSLLQGNIQLSLNSIFKSYGYEDFNQLGIQFGASNQEFDNSSLNLIHFGAYIEHPIYKSLLMKVDLKSYRLMDGSDFTYIPLNQFNLSLIYNFDIILRKESNASQQGHSEIKL